MLFTIVSMLPSQESDQLVKVSSRINEISLGSNKVVVNAAWHPMESITLATYVPAVRPVAVEFV